jgi:hypothetical protein
MWRAMRIRGFRFVAAGLVTVGVFLIVTGGDQAAARDALVGGLLYAVADLVLEWHNRRRY